MARAGALLRARDGFLRIVERRPAELVLAGSSLVSLVLYLGGALFNHGLHYYYLIWNLFLAWLPLLFAYLLLKILRRQAWSGWPAVVLTFLWLLFLPNSFYMISDFVHLNDSYGANLLYNVAMIAAFALSGFAVGFASLRRLQNHFVKRGHNLASSWWLVAAILFVSSYAVYLGRVIRLNSWDFFTNSSAVIYAVTDQIMRPADYFFILGVTASLFLLLMTAYLIFWQAERT